MSSASHLRLKGEAKMVTSHRLHTDRKSLHISPPPFGGRGNVSRISTPMTIVSPRKQRFPQPKSVEDDEDNLSNLSDFEEDEVNTPFTFQARSRSTADGVMNKCDWCTRMTTMGELTLVTQDKVSKSFCSEDCQDLFKDDVLRQRICQWCKRHFPNDPNMIVVEPSIESVPLQFCQQSCINKYKMELFCMEVKEQLRRIKEDNVQIPSVSSLQTGHSERKILITPELWSEGESALVFINENGGSDRTSDSNNNDRSLEFASSERKRKGHTMENVISKLSKRHHRYTIKPAEEPMTQNHALDNQTTAINLTLQRTAGTNEERGDNLKTNNHQPNSVKVTEEPTKQWNGSMVIPIPVLIPVPIPIPIPMAALSQALLKPAQKQEKTTLASQPQTREITPHRPTSIPQTTRNVTVTHSAPQSAEKSEKRYILKRQLRSDEPE